MNLRQFVLDAGCFNEANRDRWIEACAKKVPPGSAVIDVGAGPCKYRGLFAHCRYVAQDFCQYEGSSQGLLQDKGHWSYGKIDYVCDATAIPVPDGSFDAVLCTEVLEHVPDPAAVLRELGRILKADGVLFLTAPLGSGLHHQPHHYYGGFTPHFYRRFLEEAGFTIASISPNGGFFRFVAQEVNRAGGILQKHFPVWHPGWWLATLLLRSTLPRWLAGFDESLKVIEFTVGYHVEAVKR